LTDLSRARLTVDLDALAENHSTLIRHAAGAQVAPVVKADGYGLGCAEVSRRLWDDGARSFFVARIEEGEALRAGLGAARPARIYVLDGVASGAMARMAAAGLTPVLNSLVQIEEAAAFGRRHGEVEAALHIDTGLNRLGLRTEEAASLAQASDRMAGVRLVLVMSHLACAADPDHPMNRRQLQAFQQASTAFPGVARSLANSGGIFLGPDYAFDLVRPGITLYGGGPRERHDPRFKAVARLDAPILQVRSVPPGESIGYDATFTAPEPMRVAVVPVGHADGYLRFGAGKAFAWFEGARRPVLGCVSMDLIVIDVTGCEGARPGAPVEIMGPNVLVDDLAAAAGTISYEVLVRQGRRAERIYLPQPD
jgi:alanine racemase